MTAIVSCALTMYRIIKDDKRYIAVGVNTEKDGVNSSLTLYKCDEALKDDDPKRLYYTLTSVLRFCLDSQSFNVGILLSSLFKVLRARKQIIIR